MTSDRNTRALSILRIGVGVPFLFGLVYMLALLFSSNYPGTHVAPWQYFGASLDHLVLAMCFGAFLLGTPEAALSLGPHLRRGRTNSAVGAARAVGGNSP